MLARRVKSWWNDRVNEGCQLSRLEDFQEKFDWVDCAGEHNNGAPTNWKYRVSVDALHRDFCAHTGLHPSKNHFWATFRDMTHGRYKTVNKLVRYSITDRLTGRMRVKFCVFGKKPDTVHPM